MADRSVSIALEAKVAGFINGMQAAGRSVSAFEQSLDKSAKKRAALDQLGATAGKVGLAAAAGLAATVVAAANFDQAMSNVQAATHETAANMNLLRDAAIEAGASTAFSATEAAAGIENLAKAGVSTQDILSGGLSGALDLAAAGNMGVAEAAEAAATAMTQFGLSGEQVPHVADLLAAAAGKAQGEVADFSQALNQSGLVASQMGLSIEETTGALGAFASAGLLGSDAGTSLKTMLLRLANPSAEAARAMEQFGINAYDASGNMVTVADLAGQLQGAFEGQSQATRDAAMSTIFGSDAIRAANVLYTEGSDGITEWTNNVNDAGYAAETAATRLDNLKGDLEELGGAIETALIGTGDGAQGMLRGLTQGATDTVNAFNGLPPVMQDVTAGALGLTALLGGGAWVGSKMLIGISETRTALADLGAQAPRTSRALRGLGTAAVIAGSVIALDQAIDGLLKSARDAVPGTEELTGRLLDLSNAKASDIGKEFRNLGEDLAFLADEGAAVDATDWIPNFTGLIPGWENAGEQFDRVKEQLQGLDSALANIASSGSAEQATAALASLMEAEGLNAAQRDTLIEQLPLYQEALAGAANQAKLSGDAARGNAAATDEETGAAEAAAQAQRDLANSLSAAREERLRSASAVINWHASVDAANAAARENGRTLDITTEKGRANRTALIDMAAAWNNQSEATRASSGAQRNAVGAFVAVATQMGYTKEQARRLAQQYFDIPKKVSTNVTANTAQAVSAIDRVMGKLLGISGKNVDTYITTHHVSVYDTRTGRRTGRGVTANADGNVMEFYADGGTRLPRIGDQHPQIRPYSGPAGIVWSEEGSGPWEGFVSGHPAKRDRSRAITDDIVGRLGGQVEWYASGGVRGGSASQSKAAADRREKELRKQIERVEKELRKHTDRLDDIKKVRGDLQKATAGNFLNDPFADNATLAGVLRSVGADRQAAASHKWQAQRVRKLGLDGEVYRELLASGNTAVLRDINTKAEVKALESAWWQRTKATTGFTAGAFPNKPGADTVWELSGVIKRLNRKLDKLEKELENAVERGARAGTTATRKRATAARNKQAARARG